MAKKLQAMSVFRIACWTFVPVSQASNFQPDTTVPLTTSPQQTSCVLLERCHDVRTHDLWVLQPYFTPKYYLPYTYFQ
jgi:hypothetical protein